MFLVVWNSFTDFMWIYQSEFWKFLFLLVVLQLLKVMIILKQIDVIYINLCLSECFNNVLTCMIKFHVFRIDWGQNRSFNRTPIVENQTFDVAILGYRALRDRSLT